MSKHGFFAWQKKKLHRPGESAFVPIWTQDRPPAKSADGAVLHIVGIVEVPERYADLGLDELARLFPMKGNGNA